MVPSFDGGDDFVGILGPSEGPRVCVGFGKKALDGGLKFHDGVEDAALQSSPCQLGEVALDCVEPRGGGRREMERPTRMAREPFTDLGMLVGGVVVGDGMDDPAGLDRALDGVEELDEFLVGVAWHAATDHGAVEDVEGGEQ